MNEERTLRVSELGVKFGEGIESCIGNTPLFRIKSLSDETGCTILGKAEFLNGGGGSPKDRVASNMIDTVASILLGYIRKSSQV